VTPLDPRAKRLLDMIAAGRRAGEDEISAEGLRRSMVQLAQAADLRNVPIGLVEDRMVPGPAAPIPIRVYTPADAGDSTRPCVVYFHGGTGVFCSVQTHDGLCRTLANSSGCRVVSVEYRLAPEHPFPAGVDDSFAATKWVAEHGDELLIDETRLIVAGDSAGGTLAAVVCQLAAREGIPRIARQVLICPVTDLAEESASRQELAAGYFIERPTLLWAKGVYTAGADLRDARVSPLRAPSLAGLPPAQIHTAEYDPMRDEGKAYADALAAAGVEVTYVCHPGLIHHFYCMAGAIPLARTVVNEIGAGIRAAVGGES
jgi:acetyl esterase/lipase